MSLFQLGDFTGHSGKMLHYKLECDALTDEDLECLAWIVAQRHEFWMVWGVPRGGARFAAHLQKYQQPERRLELPLLIVDDVLTTGGSMEVAKKYWSNGKSGQVQGVVIFARDFIECPSWIDPIFRMWR